VRFIFIGFFGAVIGIGALFGLSVASGSCAIMDSPAGKPFDRVLCAWFIRDPQSE
jgi:hypothetical protein